MKLGVSVGVGRGEGVEPGGIDPDAYPGTIVSWEETVSRARMDDFGCAGVGDFAVESEAGKGSAIGRDVGSRRPAGIDRTGKTGTEL